MNLGSLVTIGENQPEKFLHLVFENGVYEVNGAHPIPGQGRVNFANIAKAAGYSAAYSFDKFPDFRSQLPELLKRKGPVMQVSLKWFLGKNIQLIMNIFIVTKHVEYSAKHSNVVGKQKYDSKCYQKSS